jgi:hypothetical protein
MAPRTAISEYAFDSIAKPLPLADDYKNTEYWNAVVLAHWLLGANTWFERYVMKVI